MARIPRIVVPGVSHHVTQRGNRRQRVFFADADCALYLDLLAQRAPAHGVAVQSYCLMPNHVHLIVVPDSQGSLAQLFRGLHSQFAEIVNARHGWRGHLWEQRFGSTPMDEAHLEAALRYVVLNPVRAELVRDAVDWPWSSVRAHLGQAEDPILTGPQLRLDPDQLALAPESPPVDDRIRAASRTGRPLGSAEFVESLERSTGRQFGARHRDESPSHELRA